MFDIPIFQAERDCGLEEKVKSTARIAFASEIQVIDKFQVNKKILDAQHSKAGSDDFDLHYLKSVLVSTGWNKNDDVFDRMETWGARKTPEDKPFNYEHNCSDIIGHITGNYVVDADGKVVADDSTIDALPAKFHVVVGEVLYKYWDKPELQERMDTILREIAENKWFVSMEALFKGFDYAVFAKDGKAKVIARNEQTAFLTKHLRIYGGDGTFEDLKVGRLLRHIVFSGKGLVRKPANPDSSFLTQANVFQATVGNLSDFSCPTPKLGYSNLVTQSQKECEVTMATELETMQKQLAALQTENEKLQTALQDSNVKQAQAQLKAVQDEKAKSDEALKAANEKYAALEKQTQATAEEVKVLKASLEASNKESKEATEALAKIQAEKKSLQRIADVKAALKVKEDDAEAVKAAEELAASLSELSDEKFASHVKAISKFTPAPLPPKQTPAKDAPKQTNKPAPMAGKGSEEDPADVNADPKALENPEVKAEPAMATEDASSEVEAVRKSISSYFGVEPEDGTEN